MRAARFNGFILGSKHVDLCVVHYLAGAHSCKNVAQLDLVSRQIFCISMQCISLRTVRSTPFKKANGKKKHTKRNRNSSQVVI